MPNPCLDCLDILTRRMVELAVDAAPALPTDQIRNLRRIIKPETRLRALPAMSDPQGRDDLRRAA